MLVDILLGGVVARRGVAIEESCFAKFSAAIGVLSGSGNSVGMPRKEVEEG